MIAAAGAAALAATATPQAAAAQPYGYGQPGYSGAYYDPCRRDQGNRSVVGGLLGAGIGATVGSQMAARGHRTDGSLLGGVLGAGLGAVVGHQTAGCTSGQYYNGYASPPPPPPPPPAAYYDRGPGPAPAYYGSRTDDDDRWAYGHGGDRFRVVERDVGPDGCSLAESPIYMPDGRVQKRFVRVCRDASGRFQVVD
jgi:hypothetical protein